jgi:hypothetical protein
MRVVCVLILENNTLQALGTFRVTAFPRTTGTVQYDTFGLRRRRAH